LEKTEKRIVPKIWIEVEGENGKLLEMEMTKSYERTEVRIVDIIMMEPSEKPIIIYYKIDDRFQ
jgi:hypothetical protein